MKEESQMMGRRAVMAETAVLRAMKHYINKASNQGP
jgi:hypothetical protein